MSENTGHVTVMRSYDYCHFEFSLPLSAPEECDKRYLETIDLLRKDAARLCDKAVRQYQIAKANAERNLSDQTTREYLVRRMAGVEKIPEGERTVNQQSELKAFKDEPYKERPYYDYQDDWHDEDEQDVEL